MAGNTKGSQIHKGRVPDSVREAHKDTDRGRMGVVQSWGRKPSKLMVEEPPKEERIRRRGAT